ncbi:MAG TPA: uracil-DNA glycosylase [Planctomycetota bacterium]|nr:uracil-DNA glycosylase [Planctomycetota bacterium]
MTKRRKQDADRTASLFRMLEDKLDLERSFGVESVPVGKPEAETPEPEAAAHDIPSAPGGGEGKGEGVKAEAEKGLAAEVGSKAERLAALEQQMADCHECTLGGTRTNLVFGVGSAEAELMFIGEAPGEDEDRQGIPFVGRAGQLLTKIIVAMGLKRADVYIANILKCRPPGNRNPRPSEVAPCLPYLRRQIAIIQPKLIVCLGGVAAQTLLQTDMPVGRLRGTFHDYDGTPLLVTYHTAYLLRNPAGKVQVWDDMKKVLHRLGLPIPDGKAD